TTSDSGPGEAVHAAGADRDEPVAEPGFEMPSEPLPMPAVARGEDQRAVSDPVAAANEPEQLDSESVDPTLAERTESQDDEAMAQVPGRRVQGGSVRVETERLDRLMGYTGELLITHARQRARNERYSAFAEAFRSAQRQLPLEEQATLSRLAKQLDDLILADQKELRGFGYLTEEIESAMKQVRMVPLAGVVAQWRRITREAAQECEKSVVLDVDVGSIELDKHVLDALRDPIMHVLRNAVAHGVESPTERQRLGKPAKGRVLIEARMRGAQVELTVSDDGRGLDAGIIGRKAQERGMVTAAELSQMPREEVLEFLFAPGFSTATAVSELSGRGVGMDVVRRQAQEVGGEVTIEATSALGGASFRLVVPLSLVSNRGLLVRIGEATAVIGVNEVERIVRTDRASLRRAGGEQLVDIGESHSVVLRSLSAMLGMEESSGSELLVAVVSSGRSRVGLAVSEILGEAQYVTQRLPWNLEHIDGVQGAVILPDGTLALVLDVAYMAQARGQVVPLRLKDRQVERKVPKVLVVDDSVTSRTLERNILQSAGYEVVTARDGEEGWKFLQDNAFDLVVSDVEMPRCTGLELAGRIRGNDRLKDIPLVLVTSLGSEEDIAAGARVGADEYIVKGRFDQKQLLEVVARLT
ncbi:MAG: response regulator, partial [Gammaproteobacteria bacterium]|nr:response regulator [Gammaproteobacteria bacterium]